MSIIRVGLAETQNFSEGYDLIFGKKDDKETQKKDDKTQDKTPSTDEQAKK